MVEGGDSSINSVVSEDHDREGEEGPQQLHHVVDLHVGLTALTSKVVVAKPAEDVGHLCGRRQNYKGRDYWKPSKLKKKVCQNSKCFFFLV